MTHLGDERAELSSGLEVRLFGKFGARWCGSDIEGLQSKKVQEFFAFLLVNRGRSHLRESLTQIFWDEQDSDPRKSLRQTLWQLQSALNAAAEALKGCIEHEGSDWIQIDPGAPIRTDVEGLQKAIAEVEHIPGIELAPRQAALVEGAVSGYRGEFLEGCYRDWCLFERERLRDGYLLMLDKLMSYCEACGRYRAGIEFGSLILQEDHAREHAHRRLMRLHYYAGDRTAALRQFQKCVDSLQREFDVAPARSTLEVLEGIRTDQVTRGRAHPPPRLPLDPTHASRASLLERLTDLRAILSEARSEIHQEILSIERSLRARD